MSISVVANYPLLCELVVGVFSGAFLSSVLPQGAKGTKSLPLAGDDPIASSF